MEGKVYLAAIHKIGINHSKLNEIFKEEENYEEFYNNISINSLSSFGFNISKITELLEAKQKINLSELEKNIEEQQVDLITIHDYRYPKSLKNIFNVPYLLYVKGNISEPSIAFVGSRQMTSYGQKAIKKIIPEVGKYFSIVSGGALGCDSESHIISLENNIKTISVIGTGIDKIYPRENKNLYEKIVSNGGAIISIFPFGTVGHPSNFPIRNEIVAGLSEGVLVIEAKIRSGSLITARLALELGKQVFALPGEIFKSNSEGCNKLIASSEAKMILSSEDILNEFDIITDSVYDFNSTFLKDQEEREIYDLLRLEPMGIDQISKKISMSLNELLLKISILELSMLIKKSGNGKYEII